MCCTLVQIQSKHMYKQQLCGAINALKRDKMSFMNKKKKIVSVLCKNISVLCLWNHLHRTKHLQVPDQLVNPTPKVTMQVQPHSAKESGTGIVFFMPEIIRSANMTEWQREENPLRKWKMRHFKITELSIPADSWRQLFGNFTKQQYCNTEFKLILKD